MALAFPGNPSVGDTFQNWMWDGSAWVVGTGLFGEYLETNITAPVPASGTPYNLASMVLPAGDWDVQCTVNYGGGMSAVWYANVGISTVSATFQTVGTYTTVPWAASTVLASSITLPSPVVRLSLSSSTTVYAVGSVSFTGTATANAFMTARRRAAVLPTSLTIPSTQVRGVTDGSNAPAGFVGEYLSSQGTAVAGANVYISYAYVSLTPGDWDVWGGVHWQTVGPTTYNGLTAVLSTSSTTPVFSIGLFNSINIPSNPVGDGWALSQVTPVVRYNVMVTTTIYVFGGLAFSAGGANGTGYIRARRVR
jgi:hypothetical protein